MTDLISLHLPGLHAAPVLATGAWMGNAVAALRGQEARLSPPVGDLSSPEACAAHEQRAEELLDWLGVPVLIAHDLHPDFHSTRHAHALAARTGARTLPVQHHHAHIAAVCAEQGIAEPVLGIALDGVGLGSDGGAWGGELLRVDGARCERLGHFAPLPLPGGDIAALEPWRLAVAVLHGAVRADEARARFADEAGINTVLDMLDRDIRCPRSSSAGRLFDAAAGLLGLCQRMREDAEAARLLEAAATRHIAAHGWPTPVTVEVTDVLDLHPLLATFSSDAPDDAIDAQAALFHATLLTALADWALAASARTGLSRVVLGGGCFYNRLLAQQLPAALAQRGLRAVQAQNVPTGDAGLALGQAWVAARSLEG